MTMRIAGASLLLLTTFLSLACVHAQEATNDARTTETAAAAAVEAPATTAIAAEPTEATPPAPATDEAAPAETATADAPTESEPAAPPAADEKKTKKKACEEIYVNSRLPQKTCKK
jgi:cytoskeletal protein RodZ